MTNENQICRSGAHFFFSSDIVFCNIVFDYVFHACSHIKKSTKTKNSQDSVHDLI